MDTRYGRWTVVDPQEAGPTVLCVCACGTRRRIKRGKLTSGHSKSCGCYKRDFMVGKKWVDLAPERATEIVPGARVGRWTVLEDVKAGHNRTALCVCDCGTRRDVVAANLQSGKSKSCGCLRVDASSARHQTSGARP